jgi:hypothetical protein
MIYDHEQCWWYDMYGKVHACMLTIVFFLTLGQNKNNTVIKTNLKAKGHTTIPHTYDCEGLEVCINMITSSLIEAASATPVSFSR